MATEQIPKHIDYENKTNNLFKCNNCAWIFSERAGICYASKYEYYRDSAWNILGHSAWNILEKYDNWQVVLQGIVALHTPLGEFHPPWSLRNLESTKIVLGKFQPKNCPIDLGSTIIEPIKLYRLWKRESARACCQLRSY